MIGTVTIQYLKLTFGRFEPLDCISLKNNRKPTFCFRVKLLYRV